MCFDFDHIELSNMYAQSTFVMESYNYHQYTFCMISSYIILGTEFVEQFQLCSEQMGILGTFYKPVQTSFKLLLTNCLTWTDCHRKQNWEISFRSFVIIDSDINLGFTEVACLKKNPWWSSGKKQIFLVYSISVCLKRTQK